MVCTPLNMAADLPIKEALYKLSIEENCAKRAKGGVSTAQPFLQLITMTSSDYANHQLDL